MHDEVRMYIETADVRVDEGFEDGGDGEHGDDMPPGESPFRARIVLIVTTTRPVEKVEYRW